MYGRIARLPIERKVLSRSTLLDRVITLVHKLFIFRESVRIAIKKAQEKMRQDYPVQQSTKFQVGDQVLYNNSPNYHTKLEKKWIGPWIVMKVLYNTTYKWRSSKDVLCTNKPSSGDRKYINRIVKLSENH